MVELGRKWIGYTDPDASDLVGVFDLAEDPGELQNLAGADLTWPKELTERMKSKWPHLSMSLTETRDAELDEEQIREMRALGYLGDGE